MEKYKQTTEYIYKTTANRLKNRKKELNVTNKYLADYKIQKIKVREEYIDYTGQGEDESAEYEIDEKKSKYDVSMISRIINNKREVPSGKKYSPNPFLIPPSYINLLKEKFGYKSASELFWGTEEDIYQYVRIIFIKIFEDWETPDNSLSFIDDYLIDYIPYAKSLTYWNIFFNNSLNHSGLREPAMFYGTCRYHVSEDAVVNNIIGDRRTAVEYLYSKCCTQFINIFTQFTEECSTFKSLDNSIEKFVNDELFPILKEYRVNESSLGLRVKNLIISDLNELGGITRSELMNEELNSQDMINKKKINESIEYILKLQSIQMEEVHLKVNKSHRN